jgi:outer membrane protein assembly factor BamB
MMRASIVLFALCAPPAIALANDWPQFRGPGGNGIANEKNLPVKWGPQENIRWKADVPGRGVSSPVVAGGRVYLTANTGVRLERLHVLCYDELDGKRLWQRQLAATGNTGCHPKTNMAAPTPVATADRVYALFATGDLAAFDREGNVLWYRSLVGDYPTVSNQVGMASSPILWKDTLIVPMDNVGESFMAGIDVHYGRNLWQVPRPREINFATPALWSHDDKTEVLFQDRTHLTAYDPSDGKKLWSHKIEGTTIATPTLADDTILVGTAGLARIRPKGESAEVLWKSAKFGNVPTSPLYYQGRAFNINNSGVLVCADGKTGEILWQERLKGPFWASLVAGDGKLYACNENGLTSVVRVGEKAEVLAENDLKEEILGTPAIADGSLFIRTDKHLYRMGGK